MQATLVYTFMLSQLFGLFLFITGLALLGQSTYYRKILNSLKIDNPCITLFSLCNLVIGIILVDTHNVWVLKPTVYVTIMCWLVFVNALFWLFFPERMFRLCKIMMNGPGYYWFSMIAVFIGFVMLARGFWVFIFGGGTLLFLPH